MGEGFIELLKRRGFEIDSKKLSGGYTNTVLLITAKKEKAIHEYVLKRYNSERDMNDMLRGYNLILNIINTPLMIYSNNEKREVAYEFIKGKNIWEMIKNKDPETHKAIILLAKELEKLHNYKKYKPKYKKDNSPDERKIIKHALIALEKGNISEAEVDKIIKHINNYIPKTKSIIHGDAHFGNFIYSNGLIYFIDPDNIKISDINADIGKFLITTDIMSKNKEISEEEAQKIKDLFLENYEGEDIEASNLLKLRTPLKTTKEGIKDLKDMIPKILKSLEIKITTTILGLFGIFLIFNKPITGQAISDLSRTPKSIYLIIAIILFGALYIILKKRKNAK